MAVKTTTVGENLVERVQIQGRMVPMRRYWLKDHWEFRVPYKELPSLCHWLDLLQPR